MLILSRFFSVFLVFSFTVTSLYLPSNLYAANNTVLGLPEPGTMVSLSQAYVPMMIKGLKVHPDNPLLFDFIVDTGHSGINSDGQALRDESQKLIKYFLATLAIPEKDLWVNLSPYEKNRIIPNELGQTEMGREMLAQDYMLKQITASLIYPEKEIGKKFWDKVYAQAQARFGTTEIPVNTFNKVWILPDQASVFVRNNTAYVVKAHLKVMLEEDYLAAQKNGGQPGDMALAVSPSSLPSKKALNVKATQGTNVTQSIIREIVLPALEQEVNQGKNFASLRQVFHSLVLASWYKKNIKEAFLNQVYSNKSKIGGVDVADKDVKQKIYKQYLAAYKKGVFNYIKDDLVNAGLQSKKQGILPKKYFSGGLDWAQTVAVNPAIVATADSGDLQPVTAFMDIATSITGAANPAMTHDSRPPAEFVNIIKSKLDPIRSAIEPLLIEYNAARAELNADKMKIIAAKIDVLVDTVNVFKQADPNKLVLMGNDQIIKSADFKKNFQYRNYFKQAENARLDGHYVPMALFAGAATRLGLGPMYTIDLWSLAKEMNLADMPGDAEIRLGMGPRQLIANYISLKQLAEKRGLKIEDVMAKQKMIMVVNSDVLDTVTKDFIANNFYGYTPGNVYWIEQPTFSGEEYQDGQLNFAPQSEHLPYGHGHNFMQLAQKGQIFVLDVSGQRIPLTEQSALTVLDDKDFIGSHRVNDLTKFLSNEVVNLDSLALGMYLYDQGSNLVVELVNNPAGAKGGNAVVDPTSAREMLLETLNAKGNEHLMSVLDQASKDKAPYNAFRLLDRVAELKNILREGGLDFNLRFKDGYFYLDAVTGDVTQLPEARAKFFTSEVDIRDFKSRDSRAIKDAVQAMRDQDADIQRYNGMSFMGKASPAMIVIPDTFDIEKEGNTQGGVANDYTYEFKNGWTLHVFSQGRDIVAVLTGPGQRNVRQVYQGFNWSQKPRWEDMIKDIRSKQDAAMNAVQAIKTDNKLEDIQNWRINYPDGTVLTLDGALGRIIKEYDIRGFDGFGDQRLYPQQMDPVLVRWIGRALGSAEFTSEFHGNKTVSLKPGDTFVIAGDNGPSTDSLMKQHLIEGLRDTGVNVIDLGTIISGELYSNISRLGAQGGLYITRSHVEIGTNGLKPVIGGITLYADMLQSMRPLILSGQFRKATTRGTINASAEIQGKAKQLYFDSLRKMFGGLQDLLKDTPMDITVNLSGGSAAQEAYAGILKELLGDNLKEILRQESDPFNENGGLADPSRSDAVALGHPKADIVAYSKKYPKRLVFNFDLDVDRVGVLLNGELYLGDKMFYPVAEYMLTLDKYKDFNKIIAVDPRMSMQLSQLVERLGGIAKVHPKGHSKVKATMDVMLLEIAKALGFDTVEAFLAQYPDFKLLQPEYSLHLFTTNERGEPGDDALRFALLWVEIFTKIKNHFGHKDWTLADYIDNLLERKLIDNVLQLPEQRTSMTEDYKKIFMTKIQGHVLDYFAQRPGRLHVEKTWRTYKGSTSPLTLIDVDGVYYLKTSIGEIFWGWSNTSPKDSFGVQATNDEDFQKLIKIQLALWVHTRSEIDAPLPQIDDLETAALRNALGVTSAVEAEQAATAQYPTIESALEALDHAMLHRQEGHSKIFGNVQRGIPEDNFYADQASIASSDDIRGGIDFNTQNMKTDLSGEGVKMNFDPAMMQRFRSGDFSGIRIQILGVTRLPSVLPLFGMATPRQEEYGKEQLAKV